MITDLKEAAKVDSLIIKVILLESAYNQEIL